MAATSHRGPRSPVGRVPTTRRRRGGGGGGHRRLRLLTGPRLSCPRHPGRLLGPGFSTGQWGRRGPAEDSTVRLGRTQGPGPAPSPKHTLSARRGVGPRDARPAPQRGSRTRRRRVRVGVACPQHSSAKSENKQETQDLRTKGDGGDPERCGVSVSFGDPWELARGTRPEDTAVSIPASCCRGRPGPPFRTAGAEASPAGLSAAAEAQASAGSVGTLP